MSFKNALKNLVSHFSIVWALLLYMIVGTAAIIGLSLPFILPIAEAFADAGVFEKLATTFSGWLNGGNWNTLWDGLYAVYIAVDGVFKANSRVASLTMLFLIFVVLLALRFVFGLYEIPLMTVLDGRMSCNARYGFGGKFFSTLSVSVRYTLSRMPITIVFDGAMFGVLYGVGVGVGINVALPFLVMLVFITFTSFKNAVLSGWAASVVSGTGIIRSFGVSVKMCFKNFGAIYSTYFVAALLMLAVGMFITVFTLGVGLMIIVPLFTAFGEYIDITVFYNKTGKRYYLDNAVFSPNGEQESSK